MKQKVLVICGGQSTEHRISRMSCQSVLRHINYDHYEVGVVGIDQDGQWYELQTNVPLMEEDWLKDSQKIDDVFGLLHKYDIAFPVLHGLYGEDGSIQGLFELAKIPYVGCRVLGSSVAMDKIYTKKILETANIPQVPSLYIKKRYDNVLVTILDSGEVEADIASCVASKIGYPCFVKASNSGSSVGCYQVRSESELLPTLEKASVYDRKIVIEKYIHCAELECAVLGNDDAIVSRVGQVLPHGEFYTFESKYEDEESKTCIPAKVSKEVQDKIREYALLAFRLIDGHGLSRIDFFLDQDTNQIYLNEINTLPGFTAISMYPQLMEDFGISYTELMDRLLQLAKER